MITINKPPKLQEGDTIGIVATSFPLPIKNFPNSPYINEYKNGILDLERLGFKIKQGKNLDKVKWWFAGSPQERAKDINDMYADPEVKAIIVHEGGQSAIAILEHIDYELVKKNPKPFIGFSDVTNIHIAQYTKTGLIGFQGPLLTYSLGRVWEEYLPNKKTQGLELFLDTLTSSKPLGKIIPLTKWECWREGQAEGVLFGGNIANFTTLLGTQYFPSIEELEGFIMFWEIDNVQSYRLEKELYQLKYAGVLDRLSGMIIGKLPGIKRTAWNDFEEPTPQEVIMEVLKDFTFPIMAEVDFGHETVAITMPIGIQAKMDAKNLHLEFLEAAVK
jgi:muramoyltetrapeptide carboxypeptidase